MRLVYSNLKIVTAAGAAREHDRVFYIPLNQHYQLSLLNSAAHDMEYTFVIDGKNVGTWRLGPGEHAVIERPADRAYKFFFADRATVPELQRATNTGKLTVYEYICGEDMGGLETDGPSGVTILSGESSQRFERCHPVEKILVAVFHMGMKPGSGAPYLLL